jgi:SAM-dependent methyltransferase
MLGKWDYSSVDQVCYSDPKQESYKKAAKFLEDSCEDWGCGTGWAKRYFKNYRGIDGSSHYNVDEVVDLVNYRSDVDNILMREVLEYNKEWQKVLENVKKSFKKKFCLIISTPFAEKTHVEEYFGDIPEIQFRKQDILDMFPKDKFELKEEIIKTDHLYKQDWILYVEKI